MEKHSKDLAAKPTVTFTLPNEDSSKNINQTESNKLNSKNVDDSDEELEKNRERTKIKSAPARRHSAALQELDRKHSWLATVDEKNLSSDSAFLTKAEFVAVSNHFQNHLDYLISKKDEIPGDVHGEFSHLFHKFRNCFVGNQRLQNKLSEMKSLKAITDNDNRKLRIRLQDQGKEVDELISSLESTRQEAVQMDKEKLVLQHEISSLKEEISHRLEQGYSEEDSRSVRSEEEREQEMKIRTLNEEVEGLKQDLAFTKEREVLCRNKLEQTDNVNENLQSELISTKSELQKKATSLEKTKGKLTECDILLEKEKETGKELMKEIHSLETEAEKARSNYKRIFTDLKNSQKELNGKSQAFDQLQKEFNNKEDRIKMLTQQKDSLATEISGKQREINALKADKLNITKQKNEVFRKVCLLEEKVPELEAKAESLKEQNSNRQKELETREKELIEFENKIKELTKQKNGFVSNIQKLNEVIYTLQSNLKLSKEEEIATNKKLEQANKTIETLQITIKHQDKDQKRLSAEIRDLKITVENLQTEIERLNLHVSESERTSDSLREKLVEEGIRYKNLVEDTRFYRKSHLDAKNVVEQQSSKLILLDKHIEQLKKYNKELDEKRKKLISEKQAVVEQLGALKESLKQEIKKSEELATQIKHKENAEQQLMKNISIFEEEKSTLQKSSSIVQKEKDILKSKLQEKEKDVSEEKEKRKLVGAELAQIDHAHKERVEDIKLLKLQLTEMLRNQTLMEGKVENFQATRQELIKVQRELQEMKLKNKGLEEEIQKPTNFHRWRVLEGTDPDKAQLVAKNQEIQKQLAKKTMELDTQKLDAQEKEQEVQKLREMVRRRSVSDIDSHLQDCKRELRARTSRLKCLTAENNMYESVIGKYRNEIMVLREEIKKYKMAEYKSKKNQSVL